MIRNGFLAALIALGLTTAGWAGEMDRERTGKTPTSATNTFKASGDVLGNTTGSELDSESPAQACRSRGGFGHTSAYYGGGYGGGGFGYTSAYYGGGGWGGGYGGGCNTTSAYYGGGYSSGYGGGYPSYSAGYSSYYGGGGYGGGGWGGGYPSYNVGYRASYYGGGYGGGGWGGRCGW